MDCTYILKSIKTGLIQSAAKRWITMFNKERETATYQLLQMLIKYPQTFYNTKEFAPKSITENDIPKIVRVQCTSEFDYNPNEFQNFGEFLSYLADFNSEVLFEGSWCTYLMKLMSETYEQTNTSYRQYIAAVAIPFFKMLARNCNYFRDHCKQLKLGQVMPPNVNDHSINVLEKVWKQKYRTLKRFCEILIAIISNGIKFSKENMDLLRLFINSIGTYYFLFFNENSESFFFKCLRVMMTTLLLPTLVNLLNIVSMPYIEVEHKTKIFSFCTSHDILWLFRDIALGKSKLPAEKAFHIINKLQKINGPKPFSNQSEDYYHKLFLRIFDTKFSNKLLPGQLMYLRFYDENDESKFLTRALEFYITHNKNSKRLIYLIEACWTFDKFFVQWDAIFELAANFTDTNAGIMFEFIRESIKFTYTHSNEIEEFNKHKIKLVEQFPGVLKHFEQRAIPYLKCLELFKFLDPKDIQNNVMCRDNLIQSMKTKLKNPNEENILLLNNCFFVLTELSKIKKNNKFFTSTIDIIIDDFLNHRKIIKDKNDLTNLYQQYNRLSVALTPTVINYIPNDLRLRELVQVLGVDLNMFVCILSNGDNLYRLHKTISGFMISYSKLVIVILSNSNNLSGSNWDKLISKFKENCYRFIDMVSQLLIAESIGHLTLSHAVVITLFNLQQDDLLRSLDLKISNKILAQIFSTIHSHLMTNEDEDKCTPVKCHYKQDMVISLINFYRRIEEWPLAVIPWKILLIYLQPSEYDELLEEMMTYFIQSHEGILFPKLVASCFIHYLPNSTRVELHRFIRRISDFLLRFNHNTMHIMTSMILVHLVKLIKTSIETGTKITCAGNRLAIFGNLTFMVKEMPSSILYILSKHMNFLTQLEINDTEKATLNKFLNAFKITAPRGK